MYCVKPSEPLISFSILYLYLYWGKSLGRTHKNTQSRTKSFSLNIRTAESDVIRASECLRGDILDSYFVGLARFVLWLKLDTRSRLCQAYSLSWWKGDLASVVSRRLQGDTLYGIDVFGVSIEVQQELTLAALQLYWLDKAWQMSLDSFPTPLSSNTYSWVWNKLAEFCVDIS